MTNSPTRTTRFATVAALAGALMLSGCGAVDGIDLNGKVFDWLGVSPSSQQKAEPQLAARAPLVLPPSVERLPEPGSEGAPANALASLEDPDLKKASAAKERERLHLAYCRGEMQWKERVHSSDPAAARSPYGPCPSLFSGVQSNVNKD